MPKEKLPEGNFIADYVAQRPKQRKSSAAVLKAIEAEKGSAEVPDLLQFACGDYYCMEGDTHIEVKVERLGNPDGSAMVEWYTVDGSALAGVKYKSAKGVAKFAPQETESIIRIELLEDSNFDSVLEFQVHLKNAQGATLDNYLHKCEITIADDDAFPTNKFKGLLLANASNTIAPISLIKEYLKMHMQNKKLWRSSLKTIFFDQVENLEILWNLIIMKYVIDHLLSPAKNLNPFPAELLQDVDADHQMFGIVAFSIVPIPLKWLLARAKAARKMGGSSRMRLQQNLLRKFLNYNEFSRCQVSNADLTMAITRDVPQLVRDGLMIIFPIAQKMSLLILYGLMAIRPKGHLATGLFFIAFPVLMVLFLKLRVAQTERVIANLNSSQTRLVAYVQRVVDFFRVIADYGQKQETVETFTATVKDFNDHNYAFDKRQITNKAFAPLLTNVIVAIYMLMFFKQVRDPLDDMGVGDFVTGVGIWKGIGSCYQGMYEHLLTMEDSLSCLHNIVHYMNLPLDICDRADSKKILLKELDRAQDASASLFYQGKSAAECSLVQNSMDIVSGDIAERAFYSQDLIQIDCENASFSWPARGFVTEKQILTNADFEISQGQLVALIGSTGSGKATLLQLLAGILVPHPGSGLFFIPPHLRLLHITSDPILFHNCSLWDNLLYGEVGTEDADPARVLRVCQRLGMSEDILAGLDKSQSKGSGQRTSMPTAGSYSTKKAELSKSSTKSSSHVGTGESVANRVGAEEKAITAASISHHDRCLIHFARALIVNPDVLIMHKPLTQFHNVDIPFILEVFREFVDLRGFEQRVDRRRQRRPRTCVMSLASLDKIEVYDLVLRIDSGIVQEVNMSVIEDLQIQTRKLVSTLDSNGDGSVSREEFITEVATRRDVAKLFDIPDNVLDAAASQVRLELGRVFDNLDFKRAGVISTLELTEGFRKTVHAHATQGPTDALTKVTEKMAGRTGGVSVIEKQAIVPDEGSATSDTLWRRLACIPAASPTSGPGYRSIAMV